jgi:hypothetical protein
MVIDKEGRLIHLSKQFEEDVCIVDTDGPHQDKSNEILYEYESKNREMLDAMKL